ncbi:MAG: carboxypeptidase-like regulatory domain-containing protein [Bacteroidota bacterium]
MPKRYLLTLLFFTSLCTCVSAQSVVTGRVVDKGSGQPIEFATVLIADATTGSGLGGTTTDPNGTFRLEAKTENVYLDISFIGYQTRRVSELNFSNKEATLGLLELSAEGQTLEEVTVRAEKSQTEFKL